MLLDYLETHARNNRRKIDFVFASSAAVYESLNSPSESCSEERSSHHPNSFYGLHKKIGEALCERYFARGWLNTASLRFFNVYGPGQDSSSPYSGVISRFITLAGQNLDLPVHGPGTQTRDFVHVTDVAKGLLSAIQANPDVRSGQAINLGSGTSTSVNELAHTIISLAGSRSKSVTVAASMTGLEHSRANVERAHTLLGWKPTVALPTGLSELIAPTIHIAA